jgi:GNAT superfamily N-acetyltransferase
MTTEIVVAEVRPLHDEEVAAVERHFPSAIVDKHRVRLARQRRGNALYLIAWLEEAPVGHVLLKFTTAGDPGGPGRPECPHIEDLLVKPEWRGRGIGSSLLEAAERAAAERGCARVGLNVATENVRARELYARRGYVDSGGGECVIEGSYLDADGRLCSWSDASLYLVKRLGG